MVTRAEPGLRATGGPGPPAAVPGPSPGTAPPETAPGDGRLDVIVRTVPGRLPYLVDALYSLAGQQHPGVRALVMVHTPDTTYLAAVQALVARLEGLLQAVVVPVPEGGGPAVPLNRGLEEATAEFLGVLDDDDVYYPLFATTLVGHLRAHRELTLAYGIGRRVHGRATPQGFLFERRGDEFAMAFEVARLAYENFIPPCTMVLRRADIERAGLRWDECLPVLEDWAFLQALAADWRGAFVPVPVAEYRTRDGGQQAITTDRALWRRTEALLLARGRDRLLRVPAHELADLHQRHQAAEVRLAEALARVDQLERAAAAYGGELAALRAERNAILGSRSWRITRLLRRLTRSRLPEEA